MKIVDLFVERARNIADCAIGIGDINRQLTDLSTNAVHRCFQLRQLVVVARGYRFDIGIDGVSGLFHHAVGSSAWSAVIIFNFQRVHYEDPVLQDYRVTWLTLH